jgi:hypothetical protein|tara:strand:+ start:154 stop:294 length:141 start_codon:yes stop_codon:yes gene_type:complete
MLDKNTKDVDIEVPEKQEQEAVVSARKKLKSLLQNGKGDAFKYEIL